jgi:hypothetical protein
MFFADGDFQSTQLYDSSNNAVPDPRGSRFVTGNVARIHYGQAQSLDPNNDIQKPPELPEEDRLLAIRKHILTADPCLDEWPNANMSDFDSGTGAYKLNEWYEHDRLSLAQWKTVEGDDYDNVIVDTCFEFRPLIDMGDPNTFHKLMCEGVGSFAIQWAYWDSDDDRVYWFPSDSHFGLIGEDEFGVYFNIPGSIADSKWHSTDDAPFSGTDFSSYPKAIKFTFRLYDSKGIIKEGGRAGRTFTHIVYLGD